MSQLALPRVRHLSLVASSASPSPAFPSSPLTSSSAPVARVVRTSEPTWDAVGLKSPIERRRLGAYVLSALRDGDGNGEQEVRVLAAKLACSVSTLMEYADVAAAWTDAEARELLGSLSFSHCVILSRVAGPAVRRDLARRAILERMTVGQLRKTAKALGTATRLAPVALPGLATNDVAARAM